MKGWNGRLEELASWHADMAWRDVWVLLMRGEHSKGRAWAQGLLWSFRLWSWVVSLGEHPRTCRCCGGVLAPDLAAGALYCSTACRKVAYRCRAAGRPTPFAEVVLEARERLGGIRKEVVYARSWLRRLKRRRPKLMLLPPNLATYDHLPGLPRPCSGGCGSGSCEHTEGPMCILAGSTLSDDVSDQGES